ncbi:phytoene desaturase [Sphingomonas sp. MAH-20]|uniref:Phytoene dehydrogenase n=1 Tax=Sphingomonas horti TaxID=2682842 RepID=A0A6I4J330_9SPHN|nr:MULTISPECIES: phytoene desaturase [Sphingomonas]MBA2918812.1 phytoene desaturase [Sphingomonas sp. CGMCC 1.13658]MVO78845.1 phytoene desaturase [Sphingomonas horti]
MKHAVVIGAGFGGLALAIRLQSAGVPTTVVEARDRPGGRAYVWEKDGFTFDAGPTVITDPDCLKALWALSGRDMAEDVELVPVSPFYRLTWPDGTVFDYTNDDATLAAEIARLNAADVAGYRRFLDYAAGVYREGYVKLGAVPFLDFASMLKAAPALARYQAWRSVYSVVSGFVKDEKLRQALSFHTLLVGGNPMTTSAIYALIHKLERDGGVWFAKGGTNRLVAGMVRHFERIGGTLKLGDPVVEIESEGERVTGVRTASGWRADADAVASNADIVHSYRDLLSHRRGAAEARRLQKKRFSPSLFLVHFGVRGTFPELPHHMILFGPRYRGLLDEIYRGDALPEDFSLYLHHPSATDPGMAPAGHSTFYALAPVGHLGRLRIDWDAEGPRLADRILDEVARRIGVPDLKERIVTRFHYAPPDFARDLNAHLGSAFSLEPVLTQSAWFRTHNRDDVVLNLYFVGAGTHPGAGIPGVVASAKATAALMLADFRRA